jgi:molecular chaperone HscB
LARHGDYFAFFGLPRKLTIDLPDLERRFRDLSRQFHPDYFYNASTAERLASLERSSYLNDAYRVLRQPIDRVEYLLTLEGVAPAGRQQVGAATPRLEPGLLEEVFELNEELDGIRRARGAGAPADELARRLEAAGRPIEARAAQQEERLGALMARWDEWQGAGSATPEAAKRATLEALRTLLHERSYVENLLDLLARERGGTRP